MKKTLICILIIISLFSLMTPFCCAAEDYQSQIDDFNSLLSSLESLYQKHLNDTSDLVTPEYYGLINKGEQILANASTEALIDADSKQRFYQYCHYYEIEKLTMQIKESLDDASYCVKIEDKTILFYPEQWQAVEDLYSQTITIIENLSVGADYDAVYADYKNAIRELDNRDKADEMRSTNTLNAVKEIDRCIVARVNEYLQKANLPIIPENDIENYYIYADKTLYNEWFKRVVSMGYSQSNALDITMIHQSAIERIESLSVFAVVNEYNQIVSSTIAQIEKVDVKVFSGESELLESAKEAACLILDSFLASESYSGATKAARREFDKIIEDAKRDIEFAGTIREVDTIRISAQEALSGVDTTRGSWETPLALGIVLLVISIALIVVYFVAKKRRDKYTDYKAELHKQRLLLDKQIDIKLKEKENENDNA